MNRAIELLTRTLCDMGPKSPTNGTYLFCQTRSNQKSNFQAAKFLINNSLTFKILIFQTKAKSGYPGFNDWKQRLIQLGVTDDQIEGIDHNEISMLNTLIESEALIQHAKQCGYSSLFVVSPPFHQLRAFMTAVTVALKEYPSLMIYSFPGTAMPWQENAIHSQGVLTAKRHHFIKSEIERIEKYQNKGDLASYETVLNYLNNREKA